MFEWDVSLDIGFQKVNQLFVFPLNSDKSPNKYIW